MNPYEAPRADVGVGTSPRSSRRTLFVLAAIGAFLASAYWTALTILIVLSTEVSAQLAIQVVLIGLYAVRGVQLWKGDPAAAQRILVLHVIGGVMAVIQAVMGNPIVIVLQVIKLAIHLFGGITAHLARRAA